MFTINGYGWNNASLGDSGAALYVHLGQCGDVTEWTFNWLAEDPGVDQSSWNKGFQFTATGMLPIAAATGTCIDDAMIKSGAPKNSNGEVRGACTGDMG